MSEEFIQKGYEEHGERFGNYEYYNIGKTNLENLKKYHVVPNIDYDKYKLKAPDGIIVDRRNTNKPKVIAIIEYKTPDEFNTKEKRNAAFEQCNNYAQVTNSKFGIITDGTDFYWINSRIIESEAEYKYKDKNTSETRWFSFIRNENGTIFKEYFDSTSAESINIIEKLLKTIKDDNNIIRSKQLQTPSNLAKKVWQAVYVATGDDPKKCLMTFTELFIFKFLSDNQIIDVDDCGNKIDFNTVYEKGENYCLKYYTKNVRTHIKKIFPTAEDGTTIINGLSLKNEQNQDELFYNILEKFKEYGKLENIDPSFKSRLFEDFLKGTTGKKQLAQFFTPRNVIKMIVEMANVKKLEDESKIYDPACGVGGFISETILNRYLNTKKDFEYSKGIIDIKLNYYGNDYDELTIILAKANLLITLAELVYENPSLTKEISTVLSNIFRLTNNSIIGSLEEVKENYYDLIMSNPPYISSGKGLYTDYISKRPELKKYYNVSAVGKEGLFMQKIIAELKPGGRAFVILPDGFFYRPSDNMLKEKLVNTCFINAIISLPERAFYATSKKTYVLCIEKKEKQEEQHFPVFMAIAQSIGETLDTDRIPIIDNDLLNIAKEFKFFINDKIRYKSDSKKIKTISFLDFLKEKNWLIENFWSNEEKIELGIKDEEKSFEKKDIFTNIDNFIDNLKNIKEILGEELETSNETFKFLDISILDERYFKIISSSLGMTRKEYSLIDTKNPEDIPVYTAARKPVAYFKKSFGKSIFASIDEQHVSFASDGDGTAGTNLFLHKKPYYINTSRKSIKILDKNIDAEYIYYFLQDMKRQYELNFRFKANQSYLNDIVISIPVNDNDEFDLILQRKYVDYYKRIQKIKEEIFKPFFDDINDFEKNISSQFDRKIKEYFAIE